MEHSIHGYYPRRFGLTERILGLNIKYFVLFAKILKNTTTKMCWEHSIHGYHLRPFGLTERILGLSVKYFILFAQNLKEKK